MIWHTLSVLAQQTTGDSLNWSNFGYAVPFVPVIVYLERKCNAKDKQLVEITNAYHQLVETNVAVLSTVQNNQESALRAQLATALEEIAESHRLLRGATQQPRNRGRDDR